MVKMTDLSTAWSFVYNYLSKNYSGHFHVHVKMGLRIILKYGMIYTGYFNGQQFVNIF